MSDQYLQALIDGISNQMQANRSYEQLTLGELIEALESMPDDVEIEGLGDLHSYRGYYNDLAFEPEACKKPAIEILEICRAAMGKVFEGYKGGEYVMGAKTPLWIAPYGICGRKIVGISTDGIIETSADD